MSDITELFSKDPMKLTDQNIDEIIEHMREKRHLYHSGNFTQAGKKVTPKEPASGFKLDIKL